MIRDGTNVKSVKGSPGAAQNCGEFAKPPKGKSSYHDDFGLFGAPTVDSNLSLFLTTTPSGPDFAQDSMLELSVPERISDPTTAILRSVFYLPETAGRNALNRPTIRERTGFRPVNRPPETARKCAILGRSPKGKSSYHNELGLLGAVEETRTSLYSSPQSRKAAQFMA